MNMIFKAIRFATEAHAGQYRKGTNISYISHLTNVMKLLCEAGWDEKTLAAGILHDIVEDTPVTLEVVETKFGREVAFLFPGSRNPRDWIKVKVLRKTGWSGNNIPSNF